ncbi:FAD-binding oxidoreductase [Tenggerimyces flavus]|uniref:FAD-binding oxidoreductase n=1 Tax=Tenggerimyces flavus TaxID=1708749 RepID=A0ABV7YBW7_9ACTN|nr:FAD-binding oxidoreductase [Tenggerimyces flavus]MBM7783330.1 FAD/FMN-containing dehydrogenase [Tenggerimyces flavus]
MTVKEEELRAAANGFAGELVFASDPAYDEVRKVWNGAIDRRPALIARCTTPDDVAAALRLARANDLPIAIRGGGHSIPGLSVVDDGVVVDLSLMRKVVVDAERKIAVAEGGALLADLDGATAAHGLQTTGGLVSHTGIAGLTLGGGMGWLARKHGLACDNLLEVELVTAEGKLVTANKDENPDLFWAVRGGGGNFGVVTKFTYQLHELGPVVFAGSAMYDGKDAPALFRHYLEFGKTAPDEVGQVLVFSTAPPAPFVPEHLQGKPIVILAACYAGPADEGERVLAPLRENGVTPFMDMFQAMPYPVLQQTIDPMSEHGVGRYLKASLHETIDDATIDMLIDHKLTAPTPFAMVMLTAVGGAISRVPVEATAYAPRSASWAIEFHADWHPGQDPTPARDWARGGAEKLPAPVVGTYVNFLTDEGAQTAYPTETYVRLQQVKKAWDPDNVFRLNQNVVPA